MNGEIFAFALYFIIIVSVGISFFFKERSNDTEENYFLGGRQMGPWVTAMSSTASDMSAWLLMGLPGSILAFGFGQMWIGIGLGLGTIANWIFVAERLRRFSRAAGDAITVPQYLGNRFLTKSHTLQVISAVIFFVCFTVYVASAYVAGASVFTTIFPSLSTQTAMIIFAIAMLLITFFGGFKAVCWTDFFQAMLMFAALLAVPIIIVLTQEMDTAALTTVYSYQDASGAVVECSFGSGIFDASWREIISGLAWGLGYFGMPHILVRFMSIEKPSMVKRSAVLAIIWIVITLGCACLIAYFGRMLMAEELLTTGNQKMVFIEFARRLFPSFIAGILMAAIMAASMSTADSQLLVASSSFTSDIYKPLMRKDATEKEILWVGRIVVVIVALIAFFIASSKGSGAQAIMNLVENAWAGFGASFGPVILLSLFWRRLTYKGAVAGVLGGAVVDVLWLAFLSGSTGIYELFPGFIAGLVCAVVVTLMDKEPAKEVLDLFDRALTEEE